MHSILIIQPRICNDIDKLVLEILSELPELQMAYVSDASYNLPDHKFDYQCGLRLARWRGRQHMDIVFISLSSTVQAIRFSYYVCISAIFLSLSIEVLVP